MNRLRHLARVLRILSAYKRRSPVVSSGPLRLWIEPTNGCNLQCVMCPNRKLSRDMVGFMDFELFRKIIAEAHDVHDVYLHHRGEPLLHPRIGDMIRTAKEAGFRVRMHTNATLLDADRAEVLLKSGLDFISLSFDGVSENAYERIRVNANYRRTLDNILGFLEKKRKLGVRKPYTIVEVIRFPQEPEFSAIEHQRLFAAKFKGSGLDEIIYKEFYNWAGNVDAPVAACSEGNRSAVCTFPWYAMAILWDGTVTPCPQDYFGKLPMGNVKEQSIGDIWRSDNYTKLRTRLASGPGELVPCMDCDRLRRRMFFGVPFQYLISYIADNMLGYGKLRRLIGSHERNE